MTKTEENEKKKEGVGCAPLPQRSIRKAILSRGQLNYYLLYDFEQVEFPVMKIVVGNKIERFFCSTEVLVK